MLILLPVCYDNKEIALAGGSLLRECIKFPSLAKYMLESASFRLFFKYAKLSNFDVASDAFATFKFFDMYEKLLTSPNYLARRQSLKLLTDFLLEPQNSLVMKRYILEIRKLKVIITLLKDSSKNIQNSAFRIFREFVANPNKSQEIKIILVKNHEKLLDLVNSLSIPKG